MSNLNRCCKECGLSFEAPVASRKVYCSQPCRLAYNNRRRDRGAELYDLFMIMRFEREKAKSANLWTLVCDRAAAYRQADVTYREGRKSWQDLDEALAALPLARSQHAGDNR